MVFARLEGWLSTVTCPWAYKRTQRSLTGRLSSFEPLLGGESNATLLPCRALVHKFGSGSTITVGKPPLLVAAQRPASSLPIPT